jgi:RNA recognition motif-containing protein
MTVDEFMAAFRDFGQIYTSMTNHIHDRGIAFVTYFDIRAAMTAVEKMQNFESHGRRPITGFAFHSPDANVLNARDLSLSILLRPASTAQRLPVDLVRRTLSQYGEIQALYGRPPNQFVVEFFDLRAARQVIAESDRIVIRGVTFAAEPIVEPPPKGQQQFVQFQETSPQYQYPPLPPPPGYIPRQPPAKPAGRSDIGESVMRLKAMLLGKSP